MTIDIVGAGMAGLLAGNMLRHRSPVLFERQHCLPNNHSALLRFRSSIVGDVLGIQFRKVHMIKDVLPWRNSVADSLMYARKSTGTFRSDRSVTAGLVVEERFIAPADLISRMALDLEIKFGEHYDCASPCISTIPMPVLMSILNYPVEVKFNYIPGTNIKAIIPDCDAYVSLVVPDPDCVFTRISITGNELIIECPDFKPSDLSLQNVVARAAKLLGIDTGEFSDVQASEQVYSKIAPIEEDQRRDFIYWATDTHNIFSLGRFATWRPGLLLDDLVKDIRLIDKWLSRGDRYALARHR